MSYFLFGAGADRGIRSRVQRVKFFSPMGEAYRFKARPTPKEERTIANANRAGSVPFAD